MLIQRLAGLSTALFSAMNLTHSLLTGSTQFFMFCLKNANRASFSSEDQAMIFFFFFEAMSFTVQKGYNYKLNKASIYKLLRIIECIYYLLYIYIYIYISCMYTALCNTPLVL